MPASNGSSATYNQADQEDTGEYPEADAGRVFRKAPAKFPMSQQHCSHIADYRREMHHCKPDPKPCLVDDDAALGLGAIGRDNY